MNDNDIVKALECCAADPAKCKQCPLDSMGTADCFHSFIQKYSLDIINRQKAEIEKLKEAYSIYEETTGLKQAKAEAIKEFAEMLKNSMVIKLDRKFYFPIIDNLVKEMTEDTP